jgi:hypothetical protein
MNPQKDSIPGLDIVSVESHIKKFLQLRCGKETLVDNDKYIAGVFTSAVYLLEEVLELSSNVSRDSYRDAIVPSSIRISVYNDMELRFLFRFCKLYLYGYT